MNREMKNSGIDWIDNIPTDWDIKKWKYLLTERNEKNEPIITDNILSLGTHYGLVPIAEKEYKGGNRPKEDLSLNKVVYPNDIVMNSMNILTGAVDISKYKGCVSPVYYSYYTEEHDPRFFNYLFKTKQFQMSLLGLGNGILIKESKAGNFFGVRLRISSDKLKSLPLPIPKTKAEQSKIADLLDKKCTAIDDVIQKTRESLENYNNLKISLITQSVTQGIRKNRELKNSGIDWIGNIPKTWSIRKGWTFLSLLERPVKDDDSVITCFRNGEVTLRSNRREEGFTFAIQECGYQGIEPGDLVVHGMDGFAGAIGISDSRGKASPVLNVLNTTQNKRYIMYFLRSLAYQGIFMALSTGIRVRSCDTSWNKLKSLSYLVPPLDEQEEIANYIDEELIKLNKIIEQKENLIKELDSYKKSLIYEYVTGKKEVQ